VGYIDAMNKIDRAPNVTPQVVVGIQMAVAEREAIRVEAKKLGLGLSTFIRMKALEAINGRIDT